jgi:hypothetical protein
LVNVNDRSFFKITSKMNRRRMPKPGFRRITRPSETLFKGSLSFRSSRFHALRDPHSGVPLRTIAFSTKTDANIHSRHPAILVCPPQFTPPTLTALDLDLDLSN